MGGDSSSFPWVQTLASLNPRGAQAVGAYQNWTAQQRADERERRLAEEADVRQQLQREEFDQRKAEFENRKGSWPLEQEERQQRIAAHKRADAAIRALNEPITTETPAFRPSRHADPSTMRVPRAAPPSRPPSSPTALMEPPTAPRAPTHSGEPVQPWQKPSPESWDMTWVEDEPPGKPAAMPSLPAPATMPAARDTRDAPMDTIAIPGASIGRADVVEGDVTSRPPSLPEMRQRALTSGYLPDAYRSAILREPDDASPQGAAERTTEADETFQSVNHWRTTLPPEYAQDPGIQVALGNMSSVLRRFRAGHGTNADLNQAHGHLQSAYQAAVAAHQRGESMGMSSERLALMEERFQAERERATHARSRQEVTDSYTKFRAIEQEADKLAATARNEYNTGLISREEFATRTARVNTLRKEAAMARKDAEGALNALQTAPAAPPVAPRQGPGGQRPPVGAPPASPAAPPVSPNAITSPGF